MDEYLGIIKLFAGNFAPQGWAICNGSLLAIASNSALFSLLGTMYGGDGVQTFALPDLRGRVVVGIGQGPGLHPYIEGQSSGTESVTLFAPNLSAHTHSFTQAISTAPSTSASPVDGFPAVISIVIAGDDVNVQAYANNADTINPDQPNTIGVTGSNQPVSIIQPFLSINHIICLEGIYPSRS